MMPAGCLAIFRAMEKLAMNTETSVSSTEQVQLVHDGSMETDNIPSSSSGEEADFKLVDSSVNPWVDSRIPASIVDRWQTIARLSWTSAQAVGTFLWNSTADVATLLHSTTGGSFANNILARTVASYRRFKADIEYRLTVQGSQNSFGAIMVSHDPSSRGTMSHEQLYVDPHKIFMFAQDPTSATYILPYKSPHYTTVSNSVNMNPSWGTFYVNVAAPLRNASTASPPNATILVEARFRNLQVQFPTNNVTIQSKPALKEAQNVEQWGKLAAGAKTLGKVVWKTIKQNSGVVHPILPYALDLLPFDRPIDASNLQRIVPAVEIPAQVVGSSVAQRLGLAPVLPSPNLPQVDGLDYSNYENYKKIMSYVTSFDVPTATANDDYIAQIPVCPWWTSSNTAGTGNRTWKMGPLQWLAMNHGQWRGGLKYRVIVNAPQGASFQMRITFDTAPLGPVYSADSGNVFNTLVNIKGPTTFDIEIPYTARKPWSLVPANPKDALSSVQGEASYMGYLSFTKVTQVVSPFAQTVVPYVIVQMCGADDLVFADPLGADPQAGITWQSATMFESEKFVEDAYSVTEKITSWKDFYKMGHKAMDANNPVPLHMAYTFRCVRGSSRVAAYCSSTTITKTPAGASGSTRRTSVKFITTDSGMNYFEFPHIWLDPWVFTDNSNPTYGTARWEIAGTYNQQWISHTDDLQVFWPVPPPQLVIADTVT